MAGLDPAIQLWLRPDLGVLELVGYDPFHPDPLDQVFLQPYYDAVQRMASKGGMLAHYTSASVLFSILEKRQVWMRNARLMNDFSELQYGRYLIDRALAARAFQRLADVVNAAHTNAFDDAYNLIEGSLDDIQRNCWIACLSEHYDDDLYMGKLSMWRAYASSNGVAFLIDPRALLQPSNAVGAYSYAVSYEGELEYVHRIRSVANALDASQHLLSSVDRDHVIWLIWSLIQQSIFCVKHPGFKEEEEWRIVYFPNQRASGEPPPPMPPTPSVEMTGGLPQTVYKLNLQNAPEHNLHGVEPDQLLQRVIIGPSSNEQFLAGEVIAALGRAGVSNPDQRVAISGIPLRT